MNKKPQCVDCHFLSKYRRNRDGSTTTLIWSDKEREVERIHAEFAAECAEGIWSTGVDPHIDPRDELHKDRSKDCYAFVKVRSGSTFDAARKQRAREQNAARTSRERTTLGIAIASLITAVVAICVSVL